MGICFGCLRSGQGEEPPPPPPRGEITYGAPPPRGEITYSPYSPGAPQLPTPASPPPDLGYESVVRLWKDLDHFGRTREVPDALAAHVEATSPKTYAGWYERMLEAWNMAEARPATAEGAAGLVRDALRGIRQKNLCGVLALYGLPKDVHVAPWDMGHKYEFTTLPVDGRAVPDGDTITVAVDVAADAREDAVVPRPVREMVAARAAARARRDFAAADRLRADVKKLGYLLLDHPSPVLARQYRIRFRGIDAPESDQTYGPESGDLLRGAVAGKPCRVLVHTEDRYGRVVADVWSGGVWMQEMMLREGAAWHYTDFDSDPLLAQWEAEAKSARRGLWGDPAPLEPWTWRQQQRGKKSQYT